jgi:class 3 adenylate cyclase
MMSAQCWSVGGREWRVGDSGSLPLAILFVDLANSSDFASVMGLQDYAAYVEAFQSTCVEQCRHFFESYHAQKYVHDGQHYAVQQVADEVAVMLHTDNASDDVYQLVCLAIAIKCAWLGSSQNVERMRSGMPSAELAASVHFGKVWANREPGGFVRRGYALNLAKRAETAARGGTHHRIFVTDPAFKLVNMRQRNLLFGERRLQEMKGIVVPVGVYELLDSFVDPARRLRPEFAKAFREAAAQAIRTNSLDLWVHSSFQVMEEAESGGVSDECLSLCERVIRIDPKNAVALFFAGQGRRERDDLETACLYLEDLVRAWPLFADGWLELARILKRLGRPSEARRCVLQARRHGADASEEALPG